MMVNPFWFGVLMTLFAMMVIAMILAFISSKTNNDEYEDYEPTDEEVRQALEEITGKRFRVVRKNGYLVGEEIGDRDDESEDN